MQYCEIKPTSSLAELIECFWTLDGDDASDSGGDLILPDGCVEIVLNFADAFCEYDENGREHLQPKRMVVGQMTRPIRVAPTGSVRLIGIRFQPGGTRPFLEIEAHELTNRYVALGDIVTGLDREVASCADHAQSLRQRVALLEQIFSGYGREYSRPDMAVRWAVKRILASSGKISLDDLTADAGVSSRQLERRFSREVGIGPKLLCRLARFQRVFRAFDETPGSWAAVSVDCGYYDQSHLIRDFQQFAGAAPASVLGNTGALTEYFTRKNRESVFSKTTT